MQISTGVSTWEVPTEAAPTVPSPGNTPAQHQNPFPAPQDAQAQTTRGVDGQEGERGLGVRTSRRRSHWIVLTQD